MPGAVITLDRACELVRTGDVWVFRGRSGADRAIRGFTNSPVNHVGMAIVVDDLPPLMWHAELGRSLPDMWSGEHQRGVQLHDLRDSVQLWIDRYGQRGWLRQLEGPLTREMEDAALRTVARLDGTPFPSTARLAGRWLRSRLPAMPRMTLPRMTLPRMTLSRMTLPRMTLPLMTLPRTRWSREADPDVEGDTPADDDGPGLETAYCAEVVALTYEEMGLLSSDRRPSWYDPGRFWSGDHLDLVPGFDLGGEIEVVLPAACGPASGR